MLNQPTETPPRVPDRRPRVAPEAAAAPIDVSAVSLAALLSILRRRIWLLLAIAVSFPILAFVGVSQVTPRYLASARVMFEPQDFRANEFQSILREDPTTDAVLASQVEIARGLRTANRLAERLNLIALPEFNWTLRPEPVWEQRRDRLLVWLNDGLSRTMPALARFVPVPRPRQAPSAEELRTSVAAAAQGAIQVEVVRGSRVLTIGFVSEDPELAARAANELADLYITEQLEQKFEAVRRANEWLETRIAQLRAEVTDSEERIARFRVDAGLVQGIAGALTAEQISRLQADLTTARNDLAIAEARLGQARSGDAGNPVAAVAGSVQALRAQEATLRAELARLQANLGPNHPDVVRVRSQLGQFVAARSAEEGRAVQVAEAEARAARDRVAVLQNTLRQTQQRIETDRRAEIPLRALEREAEAARSLLTAVLTRGQQIAQQTAIERPDARLISPALPNWTPASPRVTLTVAAATVVGLMFAMMIVYLLELADSTFRSGDDVRNALGMPCFALVPQIRRNLLGRMRVEEYIARKPLSPFAEAMRALRAGLWMGSDPPKVIAITAARPGEGKTTTAIALGRSAAMNGERVVVLDCDVRQPSFGRLMRAEGSQGIVDHLLGHAPLETIVRRDALTNLDYIPVGAAEVNSLGLFMSDAMAALLARLRADYDLVLLDAPPALAMADARIIARVADATLLCVRWRDTPRSVVRNSLDLLEDANAHVIGAALTRVDAKVHARAGYADSDVYHPRYGGYFRE